LKKMAGIDTGETSDEGDGDDSGGGDFFE
jgi:hypothetical protein